MSEEEKKAIENVKLFLYKDKAFVTADEIDLVFNLIEKQQKEIEKGKSRIMELAELLDKQENELKSTERELEIEKSCSISKDKIRENIKKLEEMALYNDDVFGQMRNYAVLILKDLLEEN